MINSKAKLEGVIVKFERSIFLSAQEYDLSDLDRETIAELAVNEWNEEMSFRDTAMSEDDIADIEVEFCDSPGKKTVINLNDLED